MNPHLANPTAPTFDEVLGISEQRRVELSDFMDEADERVRSVGGPTAEVYVEIAKFCGENIAEYTSGQLSLHRAKTL